MIPLQTYSNIPLLGLGTWELRGQQCIDTVRQALEMGYRHIDTADMYQNHREVGQAIKKYPRENLYLTTKIYFDENEVEDTFSACDRFQKELNVDYIDLLLIHWPNPHIAIYEKLQEMVKLKEMGKVKDIGVSNFVRFHFEDLAAYHFPIATNQIELHPYFQRPLLVSYSKKNHIPLTAYRPLAKQSLLNDPVLRRIGEKKGKTAAQVALRWLVQQDIVAIPKASQKKHLADNMDIFDFSLDEEDFASIAGLDRNERLPVPEKFHVYSD